MTTFAIGSKTQPLFAFQRNGARRARRSSRSFQTLPDKSGPYPPKGLRSSFAQVVFSLLLVSLCLPIAAAKAQDTILAPGDAVVCVWAHRLRRMPAPRIKPSRSAGKMMSA